MDDDAYAAIVRAQERTGASQKEVITRIIRWFSTLSDDGQGYVLGSFSAATRDIVLGSFLTDAVPDDMTPTKVCELLKRRGNGKAA